MIFFHTHCDDGNIEFFAHSFEYLLDGTLKFIWKAFLTVLSYPNYVIPTIVCGMRGFCITHIDFGKILSTLLDSIVTIGLKSRGFWIPMSGNNILSFIFLYEYSWKHSKPSRSPNTKVSSTMCISCCAHHGVSELWVREVGSPDITIQWWTPKKIGSGKFDTWEN